LHLLHARVFDPFKSLFGTCCHADQMAKPRYSKADDPRCDAAESSKAQQGYPFRIRLIWTSHLAIGEKPNSSAWKKSKGELQEFPSPLTERFLERADV